MGTSPGFVIHAWIRFVSHWTGFPYKGIKYQHTRDVYQRLICPFTIRKRSTAATRRIVSLSLPNYQRLVNYMIGSDRCYKHILFFFASLIATNDTRKTRFWYKIRQNKSGSTRDRHRSKRVDRSREMSFTSQMWLWTADRRWSSQTKRNCWPSTVLRSEYN